MASKKTFYILSEPEQIGQMRKFLQSKDDAEEEAIIPLAIDDEVALRLQDEGIPYESIDAYGFPRTDSSEMLHFTFTAARQWYAGKAFSFLAYKSLSFGELLAFSLSTFLGRVVYYVDVFDAVCTRRQDIGGLIVPPSHQRPGPASGIFAQAEIDAVRDAAKVIAQAHGFSFEVPYEQQALPRQRLPEITASFKRLAAEAAGAVVNACSALRPRKPLRILASEYWWHIKPFIEKMDDVELVLTDRKEMGAMPFGAIWKYHARFLKPEQFVSHRQTAHARELSHRLATELHECLEQERTSLDVLFQFREYHLLPVFVSVMERIARRFFEETIVGVDGTEALLERCSINRVVLRASVSVQHHYFILARVAEALNIPSIELQHALETPEPENPQRIIASRYLASYGTFTDVNLIPEGNPPERFVDIGSPRFDAYLSLATHECVMDTQLTNPVCMVIVPALLTNPLIQAFDSFAVKNYLASVRNMQRAMPDLELVFKLRPWKVREAYTREIIGKMFSGKYSVMQYEDVKAPLSMCDLLVSSNSVVIVEAMLMQKPVVVFGLKENDHFLDAFARAGAFRLALTDDELVAAVRDLTGSAQARAELVATANAFLAEQFRFDGHASDRMIEFLRSL